MSLLAYLARQTVEPEKAAVDGQVDWYVDWSLRTARQITWWKVANLFCNIRSPVNIVLKTYFSCLFFALECGNSDVNPRPLFIKKSPHTQPRTLRALFLSWMKTLPFTRLPGTSHHRPPHLPTPFKLFFFLGGTLRKNVIQRIQPLAPKSLLQTCSHWFSQRINCSK